MQSVRTHIKIKLYLINFKCLCIYLFWLPRVACGILVPRPGIEPVPPAMEVQSLNHWTAREVPLINFKRISIFLFIV